MYIVNVYLHTHFKRGTEYDLWISLKQEKTAIMSVSMHNSSSQIYLWYCIMLPHLGCDEPFKMLI